MIWDHNSHNRGSPAGSLQGLGMPECIPTSTVAPKKTPDVSQVHHIGSARGAMRRDARGLAADRKKEFGQTNADVVTKVIVQIRGVILTPGFGVREIRRGERSMTLPRCSRLLPGRRSKDWRS